MMNDDVVVGEAGAGEAGARGAIEHCPARRQNSNLLLCFVSSPLAVGLFTRRGCDVVMRNFNKAATTPSIRLFLFRVSTPLTLPQHYLFIFVGCVRYTAVVVADASVVTVRGSDKVSSASVFRVTCGWFANR